MKKYLLKALCWLGFHSWEANRNTCVEFDFNRAGGVICEAHCRRCPVVGKMRFKNLV